VTEKLETAAAPSAGDVTDHTDTDTGTETGAAPDAGNGADAAAGTSDSRTDRATDVEAEVSTEDATDATEDAMDVGDGKDEKPDIDLLVREGDVAGDYIERLLDILDYDGDIDMDVERDRAIVAVIGDRLQPLVGPTGATLEAVQELTRLAVAQQTGVRSRLMLDIGGWRAKRRTELVSKAQEAVKRVQDSGESLPLSAMTPFERKVVHDTVSEMDGVFSESEGEEPDRYVVIRPDAG
jgi:spoIIIJ-associated protein